MRYYEKIINNGENVVEEMLQGMVMAHPEYLRRIENSNVLVKKMHQLRVK